MKTLITYGTFDLLHVGHIRLLKRMRSLADRIVVGLSTDEFNELKCKRSVINFEDRKELLQSTRYVDHVFAESRWDQKREDIVREKADIFSMGDDWAGKFDDLSDIVQVVYLPRTPNISTTNIKEVMSAYKSSEIDAISHTLRQAISSLERLNSK